MTHYYTTITVCSLCRLDDPGITHQMPVGHGEDVLDVICVWPCRHEVRWGERACDAPACAAARASVEDPWKVTL